LATSNKSYRDLTVANEFVEIRWIDWFKNDSIFLHHATCYEYILLCYKKKIISSNHAVHYIFDDSLHNKQNRNLIIQYLCSSYL
jgi:hypothetical protein